MYTVNGQEYETVEEIPLIALLPFDTPGPYRAPIAQLCGTCKHIKYSGVNEITLKVGQCGKYRESGVLVVMSSREGCPCWASRSVNKMTMEKVNQEVAGEKLEKVMKGRGR